MSRQEMLDDPASAFPQLGQFLGGYFHQDWVVDRHRWEEVVDDFIAESPTSLVLACAAEVRDLLAAGFTDTELTGLLERLGGSVDPAAVELSADEWLQAMLGRLTDAA
jgi:CdiI immunity protein